jgi:TRAP-type C4-dicarboxylate transport system permease large subunit
MMVVVVIMDAFMDLVGIIMLTLPIFMPVIHALGFDPVWFAVIFLINLMIGTRSPPFGLTLFVMKAVAPPGTTMGDIFRSVLPFLGLDIIVMILIIIFPAIALWLPGLML